VLQNEELKMRYLIAIAAITLSLWAGAQRAEAALVTVTYTGTVSSGVDAFSTFTDSLEPNNLAGLAYKAVYVFDTTLGETVSSPGYNYALGGLFNGLQSPALSASITINGISFGFVPNNIGFINNISAAAANNVFVSLIEHKANHFAPTGNVESAILIHRLRHFSLNEPTYPGSLSQPVEHDVQFNEDVFAILNLDYHTFANHYTAFVQATLAPSHVSIEIAAVPEPSTWAMMLLGFAGIGYGVYRRKKLAALAA